MDNVNVEILNIFDHFTYHSSTGDDYVNGLYEVNINGRKGIIVRNGDSWGVLSYFVGEPVTKCIGYLRSDRIEVVNNAVDEFLSKSE